MDGHAKDATVNMKKGRKVFITLTTLDVHGNPRDLTLRTATPFVMDVTSYGGQLIAKLTEYSRYASSEKRVSIDLHSERIPIKKRTGS